MKKLIPIFLVALFTVALAGCSTAGVEQLYQLPQQSENYLDLQAKVDQIIAGGAQYAAPTAGQNRQSIQLYDIDGDGTDEALAFFRQTGREKLQIYIFNQIDDTYQKASVIEGNGTAIESITYCDLNGDGISELIVGWRTSAELQSLGLYEMTDFQPESVLLTGYSDYTTGDLNADGHDDLIVLSHDTAKKTGTVECYYYAGSHEPKRATAAISPGTTAVSKLRLGTLTGGESALFITGDYEEGKVITDIFAFVDGVFKNISAGEDGISAETLMTYPSTSSAAIDLTDINDDGILEIPAAVQLGDGLESGFYLLYWYRFDISGAKEHVLTTYHNYSDSWYVEIPEAWEGVLFLRRVDNVSGERALIFSLQQDDTLVDVMAIYTLTGDNKQDKAAEGNRFTLYTEGDYIYAAEFFDDVDSGMTEESLETAFHLIVSAWDA